jgi:hypothetical protein
MYYNYSSIYVGPNVEIYSAYPFYNNALFRLQKKILLNLSYQVKRKNVLKFSNKT